MENRVLISVIIPVYNVEPYLRACLDSVLNQTFQNYEILCVDDASTDNSLYILEQYNKNYEKIHIIYHEENRGLSAARNSGFEQAQGKYILYVDSDDLLANERVLEELYNIAEQNSTDVVYFNYEKFLDGEEVQKPKACQNRDEQVVFTGKELFCTLVENNSIGVEAVRMLLRKEILQKNNITFYEGILHEDILFTTYCMMAAQRILKVEAVYYLYRQRRNSIMHICSEKHAQSFFVILSELYVYWIRMDFSSREHKAMKRFYNELFYVYKKYRNFGENRVELECGKNPANECLYHLLQIDKMPLFNARHIKSIVEREYVIVYGAGRMAADIIFELNNLEISIYCLAVSNRKNNPEELFGIKVREIAELVDIKEKAAIVIAVMQPQFKKEIKEQLERLGFTNVIEVKER